KPCEVDSVSVEPAFGVVGQIGAGLMYSAEPKTVPDICNGQKLDAYSYDWQWTNGATFASVSDYPECGNGIVEKGEDCEVPAGTRGTAADINAELARMGCSFTCLNLGNSIKCGTLAVGYCGNGTTDTGEECDGQVWCSDKCLKNGSNVSYNSFCGNGVIENGEECELGTMGCSSICLWMGTAACADDGDVSCCGNGVKERWEECDDGDNDNSDGCSAVCLREGVGACSGECCGNGKIDAGEDCDLGNKNGAAGGLCSNICLNIGNSATCGNGVIEAGEDCDEGVFNGKVKDGGNVIGCGLTCVNAGTVKGSIATSTPYQLVTAVNGPAVGQTAATADITAKVKEGSNWTKQGTAKFTIQCGFQNDAQCPANMNMGVGNNGCCYTKPSVVSPLNDMTNVCPNGAIEVVFNQIMDKDELEKAVILEKKSVDGTCPAVLGDFQENKKAKKQENNWNKLEIGPSNTAGKNWKLGNFMGKIKEFLFDIFIDNGLLSREDKDSLWMLTPIMSNAKNILAGLMNFARADVETWCKVGQKIISRTNTDGIEAVTFGDGYEYRFENESELTDWTTEGVVDFDIANIDNVAAFRIGGGTIMDLYKTNKFYGVWDIALKHIDQTETLMLRTNSNSYSLKLETDKITLQKGLASLFEGDIDLPENTWAAIKIIRNMDAVNNLKIFKGNEEIIAITDHSSDNIQKLSFLGFTKENASDLYIDNIKYTPMVLSEAVPAGTGTIATIMPTALIESGAEYRLNFDGLKNIYGVAAASIADANKIEVSARSEICLIDHLNVFIDPISPSTSTTDDIFICAGRDDCGAKTEITLDDDANPETAGNQHLYRAYALDQDGNILTANFTWLEHDSYNTNGNLSTGAIKIEGNDISQKYVTAFPLEEASASVEIGAYDGYGYNSAATSTVDIILFMCNNPWPPISEFPYEDSDYNFSTYVCLDAGDQNDSGDDFTGFGDTAPIGSYRVCRVGAENEGLRCETDANCGREIGSCEIKVLKEYLWVEE
ncbi:MAG: hypothetical protein V1891_03180, partial [bacterium]